MIRRVVGHFKIGYTARLSLIYRETAMADMRTEKDSMGEMKVPSTALYGATTQRAVENFPVSGIRFSREFIQTLATIKAACAEVNKKLGKLDGKIAEAILK